MSWLRAGSSITSYWPQWTHAPGPVTVYMAKCPGSSCTGVNDATLSNWLKIQETGLISGPVYNGQWGLGIVQNTLKWTATIPQAWHQELTATFYPESAQLIVTGSGTAYPTSQYLVPIPGAWTTNDPSVNIDIYSEAAKTMTTYPVPGPAVWPPVSGGGTTTKPPTSTFTSISTAPTTTTTKPPTCAVTQYGRCGGSGYTECTTCASPWTCKVSNQYYSQCL